MDKSENEGRAVRDGKEDLNGPLWGTIHEVFKTHIDSYTAKSRATTNKT